MREVHAQLVLASGLRMETYERVLSTHVEHLEARSRMRAVVSHFHEHVKALRYAPHAQLDHPIGGHFTTHDRNIGFLYRAVFKCEFESSLGIEMLPTENDTARFTIEPVGNMRGIVPVALPQLVREGVPMVAGRRMHRQTGWLVDGQDVLVFVEDIKLERHVRFVELRANQHHHFARFDAFAWASKRPVLAVRARFDDSLRARARKSRNAPLDKAVQALSGELARYGKGQNDRLWVAPGRQIGRFGSQGRREYADPVLDRQTLETLAPSAIGLVLLAGAVFGRLATEDQALPQATKDQRSAATQRGEDSKSASSAGSLVPKDADGDAQDPIFGIVTGSVIDPTGAPTSGARITVKGRDHLGRPVLRIGEHRASNNARASQMQPLLPIGELGVTEGPVPPITAAISGKAPTPFAPWTTRTSGEFSAGGLPAGRYRVYVSHHAHAPVVSDEFVLLRGATHSLATPLRLGSSGHLQVRVLDLENNPTAHAVVSITSDDLPLPWTSATNVDGQASFNNLAGLIFVEADVGEQTLSEQVEVLAGRSVELVLRLTGIHSDARLGGTVVDKLGHVVENAEVHTSGPGPEHQQKRQTNADGKFSISGLSSATIEVTARHPSGGSVTKTIDYDAQYGLLNLVMHLPETAFPIERSSVDGGFEPAPTSSSTPDEKKVVDSTDDDARTDDASGEEREGVAIEVERRGKGVAISWVAPGSKARAAGLRPGLTVIAVDGVSVMVPSQARSALRGKVGTRATIRVRGSSGPKTLRVPREKFRPPE